MIWWLCPACEQTFEQDPGPQHYADPGDPCGVRPIRVAPVTPFRFGVVLTDSSGRRVAELGAEAVAEPGMLLAFQRVRLRGENFTITVSATKPDD